MLEHPVEPSPPHRIEVFPVEGGWALRASFAGAPLVFRSGADAERDARALAARLARAGRDTSVVIHDRTGALAGTAFYPAVGAEGLAAGYLGGGFGRDGSRPP